MQPVSLYLQPNDQLSPQISGASIIFRERGQERMHEKWSGQVESLVAHTLWWRRQRGPSSSFRLEENRAEVRFHVISADQWSEQLQYRGAASWNQVGFSDPIELNRSSESEALIISLVLVLSHNLTSDALLVLKVVHSSTTSVSDRDKCVFFFFLHLTRLLDQFSRTWWPRIYLQLSSVWRSLTLLTHSKQLCSLRVGPRWCREANLFTHLWCYSETQPRDQQTSWTTGEAEARREGDSAPYVLDSL